MVVLYAAIVLGILGIGFGVVLIAASRQFHVEIDENIARIVKILPSANCGACGYIGCADFAEAVAVGKTGVSGCHAGGRDVREAIANILGVEAESGGYLSTAFVRCGGGSTKAAKRYEYIGEKDCGMAMQMSPGPLACKYGCLGFGTCVRECPVGALIMGSDMIPVALRDRCIACGNCVRACPKNLIELIPNDQSILNKCNSHDRGSVVRKVCDVGCIACGKCVRACEHEGIEIVNDLARVDYRECKSCPDCVSVCPTGSLIERVLHVDTKVDEEVS